jgi:type 1 glutamine amidotransferase
VEVQASQDGLEDEARLKGFDLILPMWTMGKISEGACKAISAAVQSGVGLAGCHGGMCDAFRENVEWQFMTGGQWVAHPGNDGTEYLVRVIKGSHPIVAGIEDFAVKSEQYYLHVDPANRVLATTEFPVADGPHAPNGRVDMPVAWTRLWGTGRVFYTALGHHEDILAAEPARTIMERGMLWASR